MYIYHEVKFLIKREKKMTTYATKPSDIERKWYVVDAEGVVLGRPKGSRNKKVKLSGKEDFIISLIEKKVPKRQIAKKLKVSPSTLYTFLHKINYKL